MKKIYIIVGCIATITYGALWYMQANVFAPTVSDVPIGITQEIGSKKVDTVKDEVLPQIAVIAENLSIPWDMAFLPDDEMLVTERTGKIIRLSTRDTSIRREIEVPTAVVNEVGGEGGLLGLVLDPDFTSNRRLYVYQTYKEVDESITRNRVTRYTLDEDVLINPVVIIDDIPGAIFHDGGRMAFGPDRLLYITTGDATDEDLAQDRESLAGKILRLHSDGSVPDDNPFGSEIYSYGHRNPQGLTWDDRGQLWSTEHGRSGIGNSGLDELNQIERGKNYGWPIIEGDRGQQGLEVPAVHSGPQETWAPASALYWDGSIFFAGLRGESLYEAKLDDTRSSVALVVAHFAGEYGRLRTITSGPDGYFYMTTSNTDGRARQVDSSDDRIIRIDPKIFR